MSLRKDVEILKKQMSEVQKTQQELKNSQDLKIYNDLEKIRPELGDYAYSYADIAKLHGVSKGKVNQAAIKYDHVRKEKKNIIPIKKGK